MRLHYMEVCPLSSSTPARAGQTVSVAPCGLRETFNPRTRRADARRNTKLVKILEQAHSDIKSHTQKIAGNAVPTVLTRDGNHTIAYEQLAEARAKVQVLTAELAQAREDLAAAKVEGWLPAFDVMSTRQEELAIQFCQEIAGRRGEPGSLPDPVRLLEMAQALYEAERQDLCPMAKGDA